MCFIAFPGVSLWDYVADPHWGSWLINAHILAAFLSLDDFPFPYSVPGAPQINY